MYILKLPLSRQTTNDFGSSDETFMIWSFFWAFARNSRVFVETVELSRSNMPMISDCLMIVSFPKWRYIGEITPF